MQIINLITDAFVLYLSEKMRDSLPVDDPTRVETIRAGRLQDDPTNPDSYVVMHANKPGETNWRHTGSTTESTSPYGVKGWERDTPAFPQFEIGGNSMLWWRRMSSEIGLFWINRDYTREEAQDYATQVFGRFEYWLMKANNDPDAGILGLTDDFDETVLGIYLHSSNYNEGGGPPSDFIWRGEFWFDVLTDRSFD